MPERRIEAEAPIVPPPPPLPPLPVLPEIAEAVVVRPGDILIVRVPTNTTAQQAHHLKTRLDELLPEIDTWVLAAEQLAAYRPSDQDADPSHSPQSQTAEQPPALPTEGAHHA